MNKRIVSILVVVLVSLLAGCSSGPPRRVSPPAASIQQLTVNADGSWSVELRLQNYSSIPMRFDSLRVEMKVGDQAAGTLQASPAMSVGPESADVVRVAVAPASLARIAIADALAARRPLDYALDGWVQAGVEDRKARDYDIDTRSRLNPVPGLDGVLR
ncbi:MAG TPA: LEA type 2 family protein [Pseudoxanthomonas sp.]|nr:LEA type 2 family protein [Pseudoxanthomonas sp.]